MFAVTPDGVVFVVDECAMRREVTARGTSTPDGLMAFIDRHGADKAAGLLHDAMFGRQANRDAPDGTPVAGVARSWK